MHRIRVIYGQEPEKMAINIMETMGVAEELKNLGKSNPFIGLKPNLVVPQPASWGATTSPEMVRGVILYLKKHGFNNISIMEGSWIGDRTEEAFRVCGYEELSKEFGIPLIDLKKDAYLEVEVDGLSLKVCRTPLEADYLINLPVLKAHCQTKITCALKNMKGCIPDIEKRRFHSLGLHKPIACLSKALKPHLTIVDGIMGDLTHEEGGNPVNMGRVFAARDPVLLDTYVAELLGYDSCEIPYIGLAAKLGVGSDKLKEESMVELNQNQEIQVLSKIESGELVDYLRHWIEENSACSACFGGLIHALMRLKEQGKLENLSQKLYVGQGFKNKTAPGLGIGICTRDFQDSLPGCPPKAKDILAFIEAHMKDAHMKD